MLKNNIGLVIFDLDGVILDSEPLHEHAKRRILAEAGIDENIDLSWSVGQPNKVLWENMKKRFGFLKTEEELERIQYKYILEEVNDKQLKTSHGFMELLQWLKHNSIKIGLASSSNRYYLDSILVYYNINKYFDYTVAGDEVERKKPEPDVYKKVLTYFKIPEIKVLAIEDSKAGSEAAVSAGIRCIGYRNPTSGNQDLKKCKIQVTDISEIITILPKL